MLRARGRQVDVVTPTRPACVARARGRPPGIARLEQVEVALLPD